MSRATTKYRIRPAIPAEAQLALAAHPDFLAHLLYHRGVVDQEAAMQFLSPDYDRDTHDPFLLADMEKVVTRIMKAIAISEEAPLGEKTVIYSDYDTDGIPAGVALHDFFKKIGFVNFTNYIPHRHDEGFGLNMNAIKQFVKDGVKLLITIDCGIADVACVKYAQSHGIDVIVTDHHLPGEVLPPAFAIINPKRPDCLYPEKMLCGAGVIYKVMQALALRLKDPLTGELLVKKGWEKWLLDMIGIATLSDMVPLTGENRAFAHFGLRVLRMSPRLGLVRLLKKLKVEQKNLVEDDIGFTIGPRINAASRMGVPMDAFRLLATTDEVEADLAADHLNAINDERKTVVAQLVKEVKKVVRERYHNFVDEKTGEIIPKSQRVICAGNPKWKPSLLGLVANSLAEEYDCPVYLWGRDGDGVLKGSCRSDGTTNLVALMKSADELYQQENKKTAKGKKATEPKKLLVQYGGHSQSGGFVVSQEMVPILGDMLEKALADLRKKEDDQKVSADTSLPDDRPHIDTVLTLDHVSWSTYGHIERLAPFGTGNPKPLFLFKDVSPVSVKNFGKEGNHLEITFAKGIKAIGFFMTIESWEETLAAQNRKLAANAPLDLVATFEKSTFRGRTELRLRITDIM